MLRGASAPNYSLKRGYQISPFGPADFVGAFLAGLAVNSAVRHKIAKEQLGFFGNSLFIPISSD